MVLNSPVTHTNSAMCNSKLYGCCWEIAAMHSAEQPSSVEAQWIGASILGESFSKKLIKQKKKKRSAIKF